MGHVAFKTGAAGFVLANVDWPALVMAGAAAIALLRYKLGVMTVIALCALAGLGLRLLG
jgi:chromate transporter